MTKVTAQMSVSLDGCYAGPAFPGDAKDVAGWMHVPRSAGVLPGHAVGDRRHGLAGAARLRRRRAVGQLRDRRGDVRGRGCAT